MDNKTCTVCNIEKHINSFYKKNSECKVCNIERGVKRYYGNEDKVSIQQKLSYERNSEKLLQKQNYYRNKRNTDCKEVLRSYDGLENRIKALEEKSDS